MSDNQQPSSGSSIVNSAGGAIREGLAKVTGNPHDQAAADEKKQTAQQEWDASHATARAGPVSASSAGVHVDNQDRREGQWKETVGSAKESVGSFLGSKDLQEEGRQQSAEGQAQSSVGQATEWVQGAADRLRGSINTAAATLFGDSEDAQKNQDLHDQGKAQQRSAE